MHPEQLPSIFLYACRHVGLLAQSICASPSAHVLAQGRWAWAGDGRLFRRLDPATLSAQAPPEAGSGWPAAMGGPQQKLDPLKVWLGFVPSGWSKSEVWRHVSARLPVGGAPTYVFLMKGAGTQSFSNQDLPGGVSMRCSGPCCAEHTAVSEIRGLGWCCRAARGRTARPC